ncbi:hypothetical protein OF83DRAFT_1161242 [Amylostereum chailletii]|nr:hypothetical protein OF83DRAFT_1161242 [Amylostereum chailletii]
MYETSARPAMVISVRQYRFGFQARWVFLSESVTDLLGFEPKELVGTPSLDLVHPDEFSSVRKIHYDTIRQDKAAVLVYLRMRHKDPYRGYILCAISRTVAYNVLVGSVSFAYMGPKAMHNASTAQEVTVITPSASNFEFRRWGDPSPMPPSPIVPPQSTSGTTPSPDNTPSPTSTDSASSPFADRSLPLSSDSESEPIRFDPLPKQSVRTALFLDRFSLNCTIIYCSNDKFVSTTSVMGRPFFDFVAARDENLVRSWIDAVKGWGVNERGQPSDGGFGYGKFTLFCPGRDSSERQPDSPPPRQRHMSRPGPQMARMHSHSHSAAPVPQTSRHRARISPVSDEMNVDAIFSAHSDGLMVIIRHTATS